jgi:hypothetical protein
MSEIALMRLCRYLIGAMIVGALLACSFRGFLNGHSGSALIFGGTYLVLCAIGAYFKVAGSKPRTTRASVQKITD